MTTTDRPGICSVSLIWSTRCVPPYGTGVGWRTVSRNFKNPATRSLMSRLRSLTCGFGPRLSAAPSTGAILPLYLSYTTRVTAAGERNAAASICSPWTSSARLLAAPSETLIACGCASVFRTAKLRRGSPDGYRRADAVAAPKDSRRRWVSLLRLLNILAGMLANMCVESHLREFLELGFTETGYPPTADRDADRKLARLRTPLRKFAHDQVRRGRSKIITIFQWVLIWSSRSITDADRDGGRKLARLRRR